jgi:starch synthase
MAKKSSRSKKKAGSRTVTTAADNKPIGKRSTAKPAAESASSAPETSISSSKTVSAATSDTHQTDKTAAVTPKPADKAPNSTPEKIKASKEKETAKPVVPQPPEIEPEVESKWVNKPHKRSPKKKTARKPQPTETIRLPDRSTEPTPAEREIAGETTTEGLQNNRPVPMPPQAESVHVEEPLPDEADIEAPPVHYRPELFIVHISPEMAPVAKVGGLADVVFGLTGELAIRGNHVEIILPKYDNLRYDHIYELHEVYRDLWVPWYEGTIHCTVYFGFVHGRKCFFIEPHSGDNFFSRGSVYGFPDDILRFAFFSRAAMEFLWKAGKHPDIIHCHDWQTALTPVLLYEIYQRMGMHHPRACLTIHNFKHQGVTGMELLRATGLHDPDRYFDYNRLRDNNNLHALNMLKGGIVYSNFITTVSPHYAMETKDQSQGFGLEPTLHTHQMKYGGVLNGIDYNVWNPEVDPLIPARYGINAIDGKYDNKRSLRHRLMLADNEKPIVAFIGRLDPQKGLELVRHAIFRTLELGAQFVLLGSSPDHAINADFWNLKHMLNDSPDCHLEIGYDEELSHLIYAGADIMLVPSQFEPCGLTQLISLKYGTIPVVRAVGGLADTIFDKDYSHRSLHERNGYVFENYDPAGLESALARAISCFYQYPEHFRELIRNAMRTDYSWNVPGQDYMNIYDFIRNK